MCTTIRKAKKGLLNYFFHQTFATNVGSVLPTRMDGPVCYINAQIGQHVTFTIAICVTHIDFFCSAEYVTLSKGKGFPLLFYCQFMQDVNKDKSQFVQVEVYTLAVFVPQSNILFPYRPTLLRHCCGGVGYLSAQSGAMHLPHLSLATATDIFMLPYSNGRRSV